MAQLKTIKRRSVTSFALAAFGILLASQTVQGQGYRYNEEHRRPVDATIRDLQWVAANNTCSRKEDERYDNAMRHLSQFEERLHQGRFDKDKLDDAIGDVQHVLDNNPMHGRAREVLTRDVWDLRELRARYGRYRYGG